MHSILSDYRFWVFTALAFAALVFILFHVSKS